MITMAYHAIFKNGTWVDISQEQFDKRKQQESDFVEHIQKMVMKEMVEEAKMELKEENCYE
jgi:undecaprenyl pyrophosphate synthase